MTKKQCPLGDACDLTTAWMAGAAKAQDQIKAQAAEIERLREALQWCSGSADFNEGGVAREGWLKLCAPLLTGSATVEVTDVGTKAHVRCETILAQRGDKP